MKIDINESFNINELFKVKKTAPKKEKLCPACKKSITAKVIARKEKHIYRRAFSESKLLDILKADFDINLTYHFLSGGDIDSLSYLKHIVRTQKIKYLLFSTWCMALDDVLQFEEWLNSGKIKRLDAYCGEIFPGSYSDEFVALKKIVKKCSGRVCIFRNHAKIFAGIGDKFAFGIESSANINTNPRTENTILTFGEDIFDFYKEYFDGIKSFNRDFDDWKVWNNGNSKKSK